MTIGRSLLLGSGMAVILALGMVEPSLAQDIVPPKQYTVSPGGLNLSDGSLALSVVDIEVGTLKLERFLRSGLEQPNYPMFGKNFSSNFDIYVSKVVTAGNPYDKLIVHIGNSASGTYQQYQGSTTITGITVDAQKGRLVLSGGKYVYTDNTGTIYTFSSTVSASGLPFAGQSKRVERIDFPDGRVQTFSYDGSSRLKLVEDSAGYAMLFDYNASGDVSAACGFVRAQTYVSASSTCAGGTRKTSYTYITASPRNLLTTVTDVLNQVTTYTNTTRGVTCIKPPGSSTCTFTITNYEVLDSSRRGFRATQTMADGAVWQLLGGDESMNPPGNREDIASDFDGARYAILTDPADKQTFLTFTKSSPYTLQDPNGRYSEFRFEGAAIGINGGIWTGSMLREAIYPEGNRYLAEYNGPLRSLSKETLVAKPGSGLSNLEKTYGYNLCTTAPGTYQNCTKPIWIKDPKGNQTDLTYASHGGVLTEMQPAPATGAARPLTVTTWTQRYAWIKNSGGSLVQASTPVWVKATETQCQTLVGLSPSPTCDPSAQQTTTTYEYGATSTGEALLVKGTAVASGGTTLRTCQSYDPWHRKISETQPNAGLTSCP